MRKHNSSNERIKRRYLVFEKEARRQSEATIDSIAKSLSRFEEYTNYKDFKRFHFEQAVAFKRHLASLLNQQTGEPLSKSTISITLRHLKRFFEWLSQQSGYKSGFSYSDAEYFNLSEKDARVASSKRPTRVPTVEQIKQVLAVMPVETDIDLRNRALIAFTLLTGTRDSATASLKLGHVNVAEGYLFQDARDVNVKNSKTFTTYFFQIDEEITQIFLDWVSRLREDLLWSDTDPLFPATEVKRKENLQFAVQGLSRTHWKTTGSIRTIFKRAFEGAGLPYFNPHSFRNTLVNYGQLACKTPEEFKAWSQNLGHEGVLTTFTSYGEVSQRRQAELIGKISPLEMDSDQELTELLKTMIREVRRGN